MSELHAHTKGVSPCSDIPKEELAKIYARIGVSSVALTNHFMLGYDLDEYIEAYEKCEFYGKKEGVNILLGMEIRFSNENHNDYLVYGIDKDDIKRAYTYLDKDLKTFYTEFKNDRNVIIQAHPFRNGMELMDVAYLDGIEVFNLHPSHNSRVAVASKFVSEHPYLIATGGTDFHHYNQEGMCLTLTKEEIKDSFQLAKILKSGDYRFKTWDYEIKK